MNFTLSSARYAERLNVINMLRHRQGVVNINPETFDMAFERNVMTANSQVLILILPQSPTIANHPSPNRVNTLLGVVNQCMKARWSR